MNRTQLIRTLIGAAATVLAPPMLALQRRRDVAPVVLYHRVSSERDAAYDPLESNVFEQHCTFLAHNFHVLPLGELIDRLRKGKPIRGCCAITFDDGYRDFLEHAYPILQRHSLPVAHFLVADSVERGLPPWTYRLRRLARAYRWSPQELRATMRRLGTMAATERYSWLEQEEGRAPSDPPFPRMLDANDIRTIGSDLVEWASHTASHPFLDRSPSDEWENELRGSMQRLQAATGSAIRYLAYPNAYFSDGVMRAVERSGYDEAFTVYQDSISAGSPRFALPRVDVGSVSARMLALEVTGAVEYVRRLRRP